MMSWATRMDSDSNGQAAYVRRAPIGIAFLFVFTVCVSSALGALPTFTAQDLGVVACGDCADGQGRRIKYTVYNNEQSRAIGDVHVKIPCGETAEFPISCRSTEDDNGGVITGWSHRTSQTGTDLDGDGTNDCYASWVATGISTDLDAGDHLNFTLVYCDENGASLDDTVEFRLTDTRANDPEAPVDGNYPDIPDDPNGNDRPGWRNRWQHPDSDANVGFAVAFVPPPPCPAVSTWGMAIIMLGLLAVGTIVLRKRFLTRA